MANLPSREYLLECFDYDKETDTLTWRKRPAEHFDSAWSFKSFKTRFAGKKATHRTVGLNGLSLTRSKIVFKILNGHDSNTHADTKGKSYKRGNLFIARITFNNNRFQKNFKTEIEAQEWLKDMRVKFEKNQLPIVKHKKVSKDGFHGVTKKRNRFEAKIYYAKKNIHIGSFKTAKEASDAYQLAKQQIKDGVFVPPPKKINKTGFAGVVKHWDRFRARYKGNIIGTFDTPEEAHAAYLKAKNHKTFDDGLDILQKLAQQYG
jgi:hypothetical protein